MPAPGGAVAQGVQDAQRDVLLVREGAVDDIPREWQTGPVKREQDGQKNQAGQAGQHGQTDQSGRDQAE